MKKTVYILMLVLPMLISAQDSFSLTGGYIPKGFGANASYNIPLSENEYFKIALLYSQTEEKVRDIKIPYQNYNVNLGYFKNIINKRDIYYLALGGGAAIGYDDINNNESILSNGGIIDGESKIVYGLFTGAETYYYLYDKFALLAVLNGVFHFNSDLGITNIYGGLGVRITL